jgi:hypothetical protein
MNKKLASLGDAFVNFVYSIALSEKLGEPVGAKVKSQILADALRKAGLRRCLPSRTDRHTQGDAAEALIVYAWLQGILTLSEAIQVIEEKAEEPVEAFTTLLTQIEKRLAAP